MGCKCWIAGLTFCVAATGWEPAAAQTPAGFAVQVFLQDVGRVPSDVLEHAKHAATRVFALSNIDLQWIGHGPYQPCSLTVSDRGKTDGRYEPWSIRHGARTGNAKSPRNTRLRLLRPHSALQRGARTRCLSDARPCDGARARSSAASARSAFHRRRDARDMGWRASEPGKEGLFDLFTG